MIKLIEIFNKSSITIKDINDLIIDIIAYRGTMGSGEVWKILSIFGIEKDKDNKGGSALQKMENLDQKQRNDLYYKLKNLMNLNEIKSVSPINAPANVWRQGIDEDGNEYDDLDFDRMHELFKKYQHKEFSDLSNEDYWKEIEEYTNNIDDGEGYKNISIKTFLDDFRMWLDSTRIVEIKLSANPLDAPANLIVKGELDWENLHNIFEKYKDKFFPEMDGEEYIDWVNEYIADSDGWDEEILDQLKNLTIGQVMGHLKGYIDYMNYQKGKKLFEIKPLPGVTIDMVWELLRQKYKTPEGIVDTGNLYEKYGYIKWSKSSEETRLYNDFRTHESERKIFLRYLQDKGKLVDFYRELKAL